MGSFVPRWPTASRPDPRSVAQPAAKQRDPGDEERSCHGCSLDFGLLRMEKGQKDILSPPSAVRSVSYLVDFPEEQERDDDRKVRDGVSDRVQDSLVLVAVARRG